MKKLFLVLCIFLAQLTPFLSASELTKIIKEIINETCPNPPANPENTSETRDTDLSSARITSKESSTSSQINLEGVPSAIINSSVNAITGTYLDAQTDLFTADIEPITLQRIYASDQSYQNHKNVFSGKWNFNHGGKLEISGGVLIIKHEGSSNFYDFSNKAQFHLKLGKFARGITNCSRGVLSGQTNIKNNSVWRLSGTSFYYEYLLVTGSGEGLHFRRGITKKGSAYLLFNVRRPNGNQYVYDYDEEFRIRNIECKNHQGENISQINISYENYKKNKIVTATASNRKQVDYQFHKHNGYHQLISVNKSDAPKETYTYNFKNKIIRKDLPEGRFQEVEYYKSHKNDVGGVIVDLPSKDYRVGKVRCLKAPVGHDGAPVITHRFFYHKEKNKKKELQYGVTGVYDALGHKTDYFYNSTERLGRIVRFDENTPYSAERFVWGEKKTPNEANLLCRTLEDGYGHVLMCRSYDYDERGNVTQEHLCGNLTGRSSNPVSMNGEFPNLNGEHYQKNYSYSNNDFNLKVREDNGRQIIHYGYVENTNRLCKQLIHDTQGNLKIRQFFWTDKNGAIIKEVIDDGTEAGEWDLTNSSLRRIKNIKPRYSTPVGLPDSEEEKYWDYSKNEEVLLKKTTYEYDSFGNTTRQHVYDANGTHQYTLIWEYDSMGNITKEVDAIGREIHRKYDANGNLIFQQGPNFGYYSLYTYDFADRLIKHEDVHDGGVHLSQSYKYNVLNQLITSSDVFGNCTNYTYDHQGRVIETEYPPRLDEHGTHLVHPREKNFYDIMGNLIGKSDARGFYTAYGMTAHGKPYFIYHPDGSAEFFEYTLDGLVEKAKTAMGITAENTYDYQGRIVEQIIYDANNEYIGTKTFNYNAFHLLSEKDETGVETHYEYDFAGRLVSTVKEGHKSSFVYDSLGRINKTLEYFSETDYTAKVQEYDLADRVVEERTEDSSGNVLTKVNYAYDCDDNKIVESHYYHNGPSITFTEYGPYHTPSFVTDNDGTSHYTYNYHDTNRDGQTVLATTSYDKMGNSTEIVFNTGGFPEIVIKKNSLGQIISHQEMHYDTLGNRTHLHEFVHTFLNDLPVRSVVTLWSYDAGNRESMCYEAYSTPLQRQTQRIYDQRGLLDTIIKPDGTCIKHIYDAQGRMVQFGGEQTFYKLEYDNRHNVINVTSVINQKELQTKRTYGSHHQLISETLPAGLTTQYEYDKLGRPKLITLPNGSSVNYAYDSIFLKQVSYGRYVHTYDHYDQAGSLIKETLINGNSFLYNHDSMGRLQSLQTEGFLEILHSYDKMGNLLHQQISDKQGDSHSRYSYDSLYQLVKEEGTNTHEYAYDSLYNRVQKDGAIQEVNELNQLLQNAHSHFTYDRNGNLIQENRDGQEVLYEYDIFDRLTTITKNNEKVEYTYDELNRRLSKVTPNGCQFFFYLGQNEVGSADEKGNIQELRVLGIGQKAEIGAALLIELQGKAYTPIHDHNGNVRCLIDESGDVFESYEYTAYGEEKLLQETTLNPWRFSSKRTDPETEFVYFGRRYYSPSIGRWITTDPAGFTDGLNLYIYVHNNPLTHYDLYGLQDIGLSSSSVEKNRQWVINDRKDYKKIPKVQKPATVNPEFNQYKKKKIVRHVATTGFVGEKEIENERIILVNGIMTTEKYLRESAQQISDNLGGVKIYYAYNPTRGIIGDLIGCSLELLGHKTETCHNIERLCEEAYGIHGKDVCIMIVAHSRGTITVRNGLKNSPFKDNIDYLAVAPAAYISDKAAKSVVHYRSERDWIVSNIDFIGKMKSKNTTRTLKAHPEAPFHDHDFRSPTYANPIKEDMVYFLNNKGYKNE